MACTINGDEMNPQTLLIFDLDGIRFGVDASRVRETIWLPELTPAEEVPTWIVGLFSLRGRIVAVADLHLRFGHPARSYSPVDQVVVLEAEPLAMGIIVSEVIEVIALSGEPIQPPPRFDTAGHGFANLVAGEVRVGDDLVALLDVSRLVQATEEPALAGAAERLTPAVHFCPDATPEERALFHLRAVVLRESSLEEEGERLGLAVVELGGECFGVELASVLEFCDIAQLSPIPCCPPHILGAMNLRGDLLTLIDPRAALNLAPAPRGGKAVVASLGEQALAIAVDEVRDIIYLRGHELQLPPSALREQCGEEITGTAPYAGRMMTVLDLPALLAREEWVVNENVSFSEG